MFRFRVPINVTEGRARLLWKGRKGWLSELEKKGLHQAAEILENYGINSETDVSVLDRDDFCKLASRGLKPLEAKKLQRKSFLCCRMPTMATCCCGSREWSPKASVLQ